MNKSNKDSILQIFAFGAVFVSLAIFETPHANAASTTVPIKFTLAAAGQVSLNIYDSKGYVVRELLHAAVRPKGPVTETWDGLDAGGKPVAAGTYSWKLLETQGLHAKFVTSIGTNVVPAYAPWPGNHGAVVAVAVDPTGMYVACSCGEGTPVMVKQTLDGKQLWTIPNWLDAWQGFMSMASDGVTFYGLNPGAGKIYRYDAIAGKLLGAWQRDELKTAGRIAVGGGQLIVCDAAAGLVRWIDPKTGELIDSAPLPGVSDIKVSASGAIIAVAGGEVVSLTRTSKSPKVVVAKSALDSPVWLALDATTGDIFVAESSHPALDNGFQFQDPSIKSGNQVKRFSPAGKLLHAYGTPGGRLGSGLYDPMGFAGIYDIAADGSGGFVIVEPGAAPRRAARFDALGNLLHEWYGGQQYANYAYADPDDPSIVWADTHWGSIMQTKVDYATGLWKPIATYGFGGLADGLIGGTYHGGGRWAVRHRGGATYLVRGGSNYQVVRVDEKGRQLVPVMASVANIPHDWGWSNKPPGRNPILEALRKDPSNQNSAFWFDFNGDGKVEANEYRLYKAADTLKENILADTFADVPNAAAEKSRAFEFFSWVLAGAPYYTNPAVKYETGPVFHDGDNRSDRDQAIDTAGNRYVAFNSDMDRRFGAGGWAASNGGNRIMKWDKSGKFQWVVGLHAAGWKAAPGEVQYVWGIAGTTHDCVVVSDCANSYEHVWDKDGLWVGRLLDNPDLTVAPKEAYQLCGENFGTSLYTNLANGNVLFYGGTQNSTNVYRITGWNDWVRDSGDLTVSAELASSITAHVSAESNSPAIAHAMYTQTPIKLNGDLTQFAKAKPLIIKDGDETRAKVYLAWDGQTITVAYDVTTDTPWKSIATSADLSFQGGAAVDANFGPLIGDGGADRKTASAGDMRVVASPFMGGALNLFEPVASEPNPGGVPATYQTGQGKVTFQAVIPEPKPYVGKNLQQVSDPEADLSATGYVIMFNLPNNPTITFRPGERFRFDASVILANPVGNHSAVRLPWHSTDSADKMTQDTYTEALLRPMNWGIAVLE